jgi:hypothetical protein
VVVVLRGAVVAVVGEFDEPDWGRFVVVVDGLVVVGAWAPPRVPPVEAGAALAEAWGWPSSAAKAPRATTAPPAIQMVVRRTVESPLSRPLRVVIAHQDGPRTLEERSERSRVR